MSRDHYLPASFIGRFGISGKSNKKKRNTKVWIARLGSANVVHEKASSFGYANGLYEVSRRYLGSDVVAPSFDSWRYEAELNAILDKMSNQDPITLSDWVHVLVPFVAGLFSRGLDFNQRYETLYDRLLFEAAADEEWRNTNTNVSRHIHMERLLSAVMSSRWIVHHVPFPNSVISNNFGLTTMYDPLFRKKGWAIPIDPSCILSILPAKSRYVGEYNDNAWYALIPHTHYVPSFFRSFNESIADQASSFIFGNDRKCVAHFATRMSWKSAKELFAIMDSGWGLEMEGALYPHRFDWHLVAAIADSNTDPKELTRNPPGFSAINCARWNPFFFEVPSGQNLKSHGVAYDDEAGLLRVSLEKTYMGLMDYELDPCV